MRKNATKRPRRAKLSKSSGPIAQLQAAGKAQRGPDGRWVKDNVASLRHGRRSVRALAAQLDGQEPIAALLPERKQELDRDLGDQGIVKRTLATRFLEQSVIADTLASNLAQQGILTAKGRQRAALSAYLSVSASLSRLAAQLGLERQAKRVPTASDLLAPVPMPTPETPDAD